MSINFDSLRMERVIDTHGQFLKGTLNRPLIAIAKKVRDVQNPKIPLLSQANCHDFSYTPEEIVIRQEQELECYEFLGDAFPYFCMDSFGPGVAAAFFGARLDNSSGAVWFYPPEEDIPIERLHIRYDPGNKWAVRIKSILNAASNRWGNSVILGYPDMGGVMDILASFRTSEQLLFDLYDNPEEIKRLIEETHIAWHEAFRDMTAAMGNACGYTDWNHFLSRTPTYIQQCDFSYMISPGMFNEFALGEISKTAKKLGKSTYHLDGVGCLGNLDELLKIDEIQMIQWVPGEGNPYGAHWINEYKKILGSGKLAHITGSFHDFDEVASALGSAKGLAFTSEDRSITKEMLEKYLAEE